jgi:hypothetical protein
MTVSGTNNQIGYDTFAEYKFIEYLGEKYGKKMEKALNISA